MEVIFTDNRLEELLFLSGRGAFLRGFHFSYHAREVVDDFRERMKNLVVCISNDRYFMRLHRLCSVCVHF